MGWLSRLFGNSGGDGASAPAQAAAEQYKGFDVRADPIREGGTWRISAVIEKEIDGEAKSHRMIRADTVESADTAAEISARKARSLIDEQGDSLFR